MTLRSVALNRLISRQTQAILQAAPNEYSGILSNDFSLSDSGCKV